MLLIFIKSGRSNAVILNHSGVICMPFHDSRLSLIGHRTNGQVRPGCNLLGLNSLTRHICCKVDFFFWGGGV